MSKPGPGLVGRGGDGGWDHSYGTAVLLIARHFTNMYM
jgi:hypothetical protein